MAEKALSQAQANDCILTQEAESKQEVSSSVKLQGLNPVPTTPSKIPSPREATVFPNKAACWDQVFKHWSLWETFHAQAGYWWWRKLCSAEVCSSSWELPVPTDILLQCLHLVLRIQTPHQLAMLPRILALHFSHISHHWEEISDKKQLKRERVYWLFVGRDVAHSNHKGMVTEV